MIRFVFWQPMLCIHQSAQARMLREAGYDVTVVAEQELSLARRQLGWPLPDLSTITTVVNPADTLICELAESDVDKTLHLVQGTRGWRLGSLALRACSMAGARVALLLEGGDPRGIKGLARRFAYFVDQVRIGQDVDLVLAMGENGVNWYRQCGWATNKVFPYAYFTETPSEIEGRHTIEDQVAIAYVGQLIDRKGVDVLLRALGRVADREWQLSIAGDGPQRSRYEKIAEHEGIRDQCHFLGVLQHKEALALVAEADLLVLPSRFDGWGAVVNEALMRGVPVICSDRCGASALVEEKWRGWVFRAGSVSELTWALTEAIVRGKKTEELSQRIIDWSQCIEGNKAREYLLQVVEHVYAYGSRPIPPWQSDGLSGYGQKP